MKILKPSQGQMSNPGRGTEKRLSLPSKEALLQRDQDYHQSKEPFLNNGLSAAGVDQAVLARSV